MDGSMERGTSKVARSSSSQSHVSRFIRSVREALLTSVMCSGDAPAAAPPVRFHVSHVSMVPKMASPEAAASRRPATFSSSHASLVAEKYLRGSARWVGEWVVAVGVGVVSGGRSTSSTSSSSSSTYDTSGRPVLARRRSLSPAATRAAMALVRVSFHTTTLWYAAPVRLFHTTVLSRWFVMPTAETAAASASADASAAAHTSCVRAQISAGSGGGGRGGVRCGRARTVGGGRGGGGGSDSDAAARRRNHATGSTPNTRRHTDPKRNAPCSTHPSCG